MASMSAHAARVSAAAAAAVEQRQQQSQLQDWRLRQSCVSHTRKATSASVSTGASWSSLVRDCFISLKRRSRSPLALVL